MTRLLDKFCLAAAAAAVLAATADAVIAAPGFAQTDTASVVVRYNDLKMDAPGATQVLERRIETAATQVCGGQPDIRDLDRQVAFDRCRVDTTQLALSRLHVTRALALAHGRGDSPHAQR